MPGEIVGFPDGRKGEFKCNDAEIASLKRFLKISMTYWRFTPGYHLRFSSNFANTSQTCRSILRYLNNLSRKFFEGAELGFGE